MDCDKKPVSFGFTKKKEKQSVIEIHNLIGEKLLKKKHETDFVLEVDGKEVKSAKPKEEPKELVIPLIKRNVWQKDVRESRRNSVKQDGNEKKRKATPESLKSGEQNPKNIDDEAVKELIKEAAVHNDEWEQRGNTDLQMSIPLLMRNRVPEGYEEDDKLDVALRPEETTDVDYDNIPIEQFGMAMLRGMGWKKEEGIGDRMKRTVDPIEVTVRPKGQGLGADKRPVMPKKQVKRKPGDKKIEEEPVGIAKGCGVLVTSGPHRNLYGKIEGTDEDNARVVIKLAISNQSVTLSQYAVQLVDKDEYRKCAKDLGKFSKGHSELEKNKKEDDKKGHNRKNENDGDYDSSLDLDRRRHREDRRDRKRHSDHDSEDRSDPERHSRRKHKENSHKESRVQDSDLGSRRKEKKQDRDGRRNRDKYDEERDRRRNTDRYRDEDSSREKDKRNEKDEEEKKEERYDKKEKRRRVEDDYREEQSPKSDSTTSKPQCYWLRPDLRVRFIDKEYKKGRHYNSKVSIIDVVTMETCTCRTEEGSLLEDIKQDMLETLIPKTDPGYVMVVSGQLTGQIGTVLKRDKAQCKAAVQLLQDRDQIVKMDYNDICEYVGDIQANDDY